MVLAALKEHQKVAVSWMNNQEKSSSKENILGDDMAWKNWFVKTLLH